MNANTNQVSKENEQEVQLEQGEMLNRIGTVTRGLHDTLSGLGLDKILDEVTQNMPDARGRLDYVTKMTEEAAEKVLNATDVAIPLQEEIQEKAKALEIKLQAMEGVESQSGNYAEGVKDTLAFLQMTSEKSDQTKALLMEIMMAQDFQDLTGQVIKRVTGLAQNIENQLVQLLLDYAPESKKVSADHKKTDAKVDGELMNGPQINAEAENIVTNQDQVDDLLDSLGF